MAEKKKLTKAEDQVEENTTPDDPIEEPDTEPITDETPEGTPDETRTDEDVEDAGDKFVKVLRVQTVHKDLTEDAHNRNKDLVLREAINKGFHPKDAVEHVGTELYRTTRRGVSTFDVTYEVKVKVAGEDAQPHTTVTPASNPDKPEPKDAKPGQVTRDPKRRRNRRTK